MTSPITPSQYLAECKRRFGAANPERIDAPVWEWMIREGHNPYLARQTLNLKQDWDYDDTCPLSGNPDWCFQRMGAARVNMPDGRRITIAGEHEDFYDPDFCIYNDVIVRRGDDIEIYAYPRDIFPPTDFHTATLVDDRILIIGSLGYQNERAGPVTPVFALDTNTYQIQRIKTTGKQPGWIHEHTARLSDDAIEITGGKLLSWREGKELWSDNLEDFRLDLRTLEWTQTTDHSAWRQFAIDYDEDIRRIDLSWFDGTVLHELGYPCELYREPEKYDGDDDLTDRVHVVHVQGVPVHVIDKYRELRVQVRGRLDPAVVDHLLQSLINLATGSGKRIERVREC